MSDPPPFPGLLEQADRALFQVETCNAFRSEKDTLAVLRTLDALKATADAWRWANKMIRSLPDSNRQRGFLFQRFPIGRLAGRCVNAIPRLLVWPSAIVI